LSGRFGEHLGLGIHADCFSDMLGEWERQLAGAAAEVEKSAGPVEAELGDDTVEERLWIAGPVLRVMPGGSSEQTAAGSA
jgi:hypothetical protein